MTDNAQVGRQDEPFDHDTEAARRTLNRHGYGFQFAVLKALHDIPSDWRAEAVEFPVELNGVHLHIDIVMRSPGAVMVIECKRVDPALSVWCFARSPLVSAHPGRPHVVSLDQIFIPDGPLSHHRLMARHDVDKAVPTLDQYHVALEIKTRDKGDGTGGGRAAIDDALTQVLRGTNGLITAYAAHEKPMQIMETPSLHVVPVIVTTARLLVLATDLNQADLATGHLPPDASFEERPFLWFRLMTSRNLRHGVQRLRAPEAMQPHSLGMLADRDYVRSVGIVSIAGLEAFLRDASRHTRTSI